MVHSFAHILTLVLTLVLFLCSFSSSVVLVVCSSGPNADKIVPYFGNLFTDEPLPIDGYIDLDPKKPGTWVAPMVMVDCLCKKYV